MQTDNQLSAHFKRSEFACHCGCGSDYIDMKLVDALEDLRTKPGITEIIVRSGVRCEEYNKHIGGAEHSQHMLGKAADILVPGLSPMEIYNLAVTVSGLHGFGVAQHQGFIHVDIRDIPARWMYDANCRECAWQD